MTLSGRTGTLRLQPFGLGLPSTNDGPDLRDRLDDDREHGGGEDADEDRAAHLAHHQHDREQQADQKTSAGQLISLPPMPSPTGTVVLAASGTRRTKPASTKPMSARNSPMPTPMAVLSWVGTARNTAVRRPVSTRTR